MSEVRVLQIVADPATAWLIVRPIAEHLALRGYKIEFACNRGEYLPHLLRLGFPVKVVPISRKLISASHILALYQLWQLIRERKYQIVHTHTPIASFVGRISGALGGTPVKIYHMRGGWFDSKSFLKREVFALAELVAGRWTSHAFTINCEDAEELVQRRIVKREKVTCLHCGGGGINVNKFKPLFMTAEEKTRLGAEFGIEDGSVVIGFIGRLVREKGVFELLSAFKQIAFIEPSARLLVVGDTLSSERDRTTSKELRETVRACDVLSGKVIFTGFREDIPCLMSIMDLVVLPSYREGFGMVLAEAAAMGIPRVSSDTRGGREAIKSEEDGLLVPVGDVRSLGKALIRFIKDVELRRRMGEESRKMALRRFDQNVLFEEIRGVYERLLREKGITPPTLAHAREG
jgi:glycosyltransferase involved in cell wall biosynthesis